MLTNGFSCFLIPSITPVTVTNTALAFSIYGVAKSAPILERAAFMFERAPVNVLLASFAWAPNALSMASAKVLKSILPFVTMSRTSASLTFNASASVAAALRPLASICLNCMVITLP